MLDQLFHRPQKWHDFRAGGITGTAARDIMAGKANDVWEQKTGRTQSEDLSDVFRVALGIHTEPLNVAWFEKVTGLEVDTDNCDYLTHPKHDWWRMDVDGFTSDDGLIECKHSSAFKSIEDHVIFYYPQLQWYMEGLGKDHAYLSVIPGNGDPLIQRVERDDSFIQQMSEQCKHVWRCVQSDTPPQEVEVKPDIQFDDMREEDFTGNNQWADFAATFLDNQDAAKKFEASKKGLKSLVEDDVKLATGHGIQVKRSKSNSLTVKGL